MKGMHLVSSRKVGNRFEFVFEDLQGLADSLELEFIRSDFSRYDTALRRLKAKINSEGESPKLRNGN